MRSAKVAAAVAEASVANGDLSARSLSAYEEGWRADVGKEVERGMLIRKIFVGMTDKKLDEIGRMMDREDVRSILATGDIDYPSRLAAPMIKALPSLLKFSPFAIGRLLRG
jgi:flavin-dependent dehydrogenase